MAAVHRVVHAQCPPSPPETRVEFEHADIRRSRVFPAPERIESRAESHVVHLTQWIVLDRPLAFMQRLLGAPH